MSARTLHAHQMRALSMLRESIAGGLNRPVLMGPTGFGKTVVASTVTRGAVVKGNGVLVTVPRKSLIDQTIRMFHEEGIRHVGVMQADHPLTNGTMPVQVATVQTLANRKMPDVGVVLVDECHEQFKVIRELIQRHPNIPFIGLSATPWAKGMGTYWNNLIIPTTTAELIETEFLSPFKVFAPPSGIKPDLTGIEESQQAHGKDYVVGQLSKEMRKAPLVADAVETWKNLAKGRPTLVFAVDRAHADALHTKFCEAGIETAYIDGNTDLKEREQIRVGSMERRIEVVVSIGCLTMGCDWPWISCIQLCRPTKSEMLLVQIVGRGLRKADGKDYCLVLDHTTNTERLGMVTDISHETLCDGKVKPPSQTREKEEALPKECPKCHFVKPPKISICPNCGHEAKRQNKVETVKGKLEEVKGGKKEKFTMVDKQLWWSGFLRHAQLHGKTHKWCLAQYRQKFGVWPNKVHDIASPEVSPEVASWIKSRQIAYAKSKHRYVTDDLAPKDKSWLQSRTYARMANSGPGYFEFKNEEGDRP